MFVCLELYDSVVISCIGCRLYACFAIGYLLLVYTLVLLVCGVLVLDVWFGFVVVCFVAIVWDWGAC